MPRARRKLCESNIYHIMLRGTNQQQIFHDRYDLEHFMGILIKCRDICGYTLFAYCLMSNHVHLLIRFDGEQMSAVMKRIAVRYAMYYNQRYERCGPLFQDRYRSQPIHSESALYHVARYIHLNPPKAGLCDSAEDYPFSSAIAYITEALEPRGAAAEQPADDSTAETPLPLVRTDVMRGLLGDASGEASASVSDALTYLSGSSRRRSKGSVPLSSTDTDPLTFMDLVPRITSARAWEAVKKRFSCETAGQFQLLSPENRLACLRLLRETGLSIRKIARMTGTGKGLVEKALRPILPVTPRVSFDLTFFSESKRSESGLMESALPDSVREILERLESAGHEAYVVGGCVRDVLRGIQPNDWDICTAATPEQTAACFPDDRMLNIGIQHGTVALLRDTITYEITTFRTDGPYSDCRHPDSVTFVSSLREDLARRDFTVNAMAFSPARGLADPFDGRADIARGLIRCVGDPDARFEEDALRVMRAMRFSATLGYGIDPRTAEAMRRAAGRLRLVAGERVRVELCKLLMSDGAEAARVLGENAGILEIVLPELAVQIADAAAWQKTLLGVARSPSDLRMRLSVLLCAVAVQGDDPLRAGLRRLTFDNATANCVCTLAPRANAPIATDSVSIKRLLGVIGPDALTLLIAVQRALQQMSDEALDAANATVRRILDNQECYQLRDLAVSGHDMMVLGVPKGRAVGDILDSLLDDVICGRLPNARDDLLAATREKLG